MTDSSPYQSKNRGLRIKNSIASVLIVTLACAAFGIAPYHHETVQRMYGPPHFSFTGTTFLIAAAIAYSCLLIAYFMTDRDAEISKSLRFFRVLRGWVMAPLTSSRSPLPPVDRLAVLTTLLKAFFGPMMAMWLMGHCMGAWVAGLEIRQSGTTSILDYDFFNRVGFWFLMQVILFVDVLVFTVGYLVESRRLGNQIRSVDPTLLGWTAALLCYPPFNAITSKVLGSPVSDFPQFDDPTAHIALNLLLLLLMTLFTSASVALGLKASNLTHRGIVSRGPYAIVRHPAYVSKNVAWWIASIPAITTAFDQSVEKGLLTVASISAWTLLYVLRAMTEEDHLKSVDGDYAIYASRVKYRFIPGLI